MKICLLAHFYRFEGSSISRVVLLTGNNLAKLGHEVTIMLPKKMAIPEELLNENIKYITPWINPKIRGGFSLLETLYKSTLVLIGKYDVLYVYRGLRPSSIIPALIGKYLMKSKIFEEWWEWYGIDGIGKVRKGIFGKLISLYDTFFEIKLKRFFTGVVCINKTLYSRIENHKKRIILRGASEQGVIKKFDRDVAKSKLNIDGSKFVIGLSNFDRSDIEDNLPFLKAFERLNDSKKILLVTGKDSNNINDYLKKTNYKALGWVSFEQYSYFLSACDIFILPFPNSKRNQGRWPNKIGDYVASNRKIITNPTGEVNEFLTENSGIGELLENNEIDYFNFLKNMDTDKILKIDEIAFEKAASSISFENRILNLSNFFNS